MLPPKEFQKSVSIAKKTGIVVVEDEFAARQSAHRQGDRTVAEGARRHRVAGGGEGLGGVFRAHAIVEDEEGAKEKVRVSLRPEIRVDAVNNQSRRLGCLLQPLGHCTIEPVHHSEIDWAEIVTKWCILPV